MIKNIQKEPFNNDKIILKREKIKNQKLEVFIIEYTDKIIMMTSSDFKKGKYNELSEHD